MSADSTAAPEPIAESPPTTDQGGGAAGEGGAGGKAGTVGVTGSIESGGGFGRYSNGLGNADFEFVRLSLGRPGGLSLRVGIGRAARFGEETTTFDALVRVPLPEDYEVSVGAGSGTGEVLSPEYRVDVSLGKAFLSERELRAVVGYTREQSKHRIAGYDRGSLVLFHHAGDHWLVSGSGRVDVGRPGSTISVSGGFGVRYGTYRKMYVGGGFDVGRVSYQLIAPGRALVDYFSTSLHAGLSWYLRPESGFNVRVDYGDNEFYRTGGVSFGVFRDWW